MAAGETPSHFTLQAHIVLDPMPVPIVMYDTEGVTVFCNTAAEQLFDLRREQLIGHFNVLTDPQSVANRSHEVFARALNGETFEREYVTYRYQADDPSRRIAIRPSYFPVRGEDGAIAYVAIIYRDVTAMIEQEATITASREMVEAQQQLIHELSSPIAQLWNGILLLSLVGSIDSRRASQITEQLLESLARHQASVVIIDIAGVPIIDTAIANHLLMTVQAARLLGVEVLLVGISSETAQTIVQLGIDLSQLTTMANLQAGLSYAFQRNGLQVIRAN